jgi:hypothetical protein
MRYTVTDRIYTEVRQTGRTYGVFGVAHGTAALIEGGFFRRPVAEATAKRWAAECLQDLVETAEREAGWDATP